MRKLNAFLLLLLLPWVLAFSLAARTEAQATTPSAVTTALDGLQVIATINRPSLEVGEILVVRLVWSGSGAASARFVPGSGAPSTASPMLGDWDILAAAPIYEPSGARNGIEIKLSTLDASASLTAIPLAWDADGAQTGEALLPTLAVTSLVGPDADPASYRDIAGEIEIRDARFPMTLLVIAATVAILAAFLAAYFLRVRKPPRVELPHERALRELEELGRAGLTLSGGCHGFYFALTDTVRCYVADRYAIGATRWTTREFAMHARASGDFSDAQIARLTALLRLADFVKFAGAQTDHQRAADDIAAARAFVTETIPSVDTNGAQSKGGETK